MTVKDRIIVLVREAYDLGAEEHRLQTNEDPRLAIAMIADDIMKLGDFK